MARMHLGDPDFRISEVRFDKLLELQEEAERRGWATRWSSVEALRHQVKDDFVVLQTLLREERNGEVRAYRCLVLFADAVGRGSGGVATIDIDPGRLATLERLDRDSDVRRVLARMFSLAVGGISIVSND
jgi:hypothetical protein